MIVTDSRRAVVHKLDCMLVDTDQGACTEIIAEYRDILARPQLRIRPDRAAESGSTRPTLVPIVMAT